MPRHPSFWHIALACRCPRCGRGSLFHGLLTVRPACNACGLNLRACDAGDGAASGLILVLGAAIVGMVLWADRFHPPAWVHAMLWPAVTIPLAIGLMRPLKAALIVRQYRHRASETGL